MTKTKRTDTLRDLAIALLFVSALYLLYRAVFYEGSANASLFSGSQTEQTDSAVTLPVKPAYLLVTGPGGQHTAAKYDGAAREKLLTQFSASLGEALGSADGIKEVSAAEWQTALRGDGVFYDYLYPQPLSVIAASLGTGVKGVAAEDTARRLCLSVSNGAVKLYYISAGSGGIFRCTTAVSASALSTRLADYGGGEAHFAFEDGAEYAALDPYFIFSGEETRLAAVSAANPLTEGGQDAKLQAVFGMSSRVSAGYIEKGGSVVYVEGAKSLRMDNAGGVLFSVSDGSGVEIPHGGETGTAEIVSACAQIASDTVGSTAGAAGLVLRSCQINSDTGETDVEFAYAINGVPVTLPSGAAAAFKIRDGAITRAELFFRKYTLTGETLTALPETQAAAIAKSGGGEPVLTYDDRNDGVSASWIVQ